MQALFACSAFTERLVELTAGAECECPSSGKGKRPAQTHTIPCALHSFWLEYSTARPKRCSIPPAKLVRAFSTFKKDTHDVCQTAGAHTAHDQSGALELRTSLRV